MRGLRWLLCLMALTLSAQEEKFDFFSLDLEELDEINVSAASQFAEPLREAPVPVTVITAEMIRKSGVRNLAELLVKFVPGMTFSQDHNEVNVAMRGVYGSSQQKFLVLVEGHRLNNRAFSEENPDFSIGLEKIKQVEVLRGPGSSLYGNVALTAVVNLVLFKGEELNGMDVVVGSGSYGQRKASVLYGGLHSGTDVFAWGNYYSAEGQPVWVPPEEDYANPTSTGGTAIVGQFDDKPSYDVGFTVKRAHFEVFASSRYGKYSEPFTSGGPTGELYDYDSIPLFRGLGPGLSSASTHVRVKGMGTLGSNEVEAQVYTDTSHVFGSVLSDGAGAVIIYPEWRDRDEGLLLQISTPVFGNGRWVNGVHGDWMELRDSALWFTRNGVEDPVPRPLMDPGKERIYSAFTQLKCYLGERYLLNMGFRYDYKERGAQETVKNLAPRVALVYLSEGGIDWKLSYASSFVDAPYWYRYNRLASYRGGANLKPEYLDSLQLSGSKWLGERQHLELNVFHNDLSDFVFRDTTVAQSDVQTPIYKNAGALRSMGLELTYSWVEQICRLDTNATWQKALEAKDYGEHGGEIDNVPQFTMNMGGSLKVPLGWSRSTWLNGHVRHIGSQRSPIRYPERGAVYENNRVSSATLLDLGLRVEGLGTPGLTADLRVSNALNEDYEQGGSVQHPYPQQGSWFHINIGYLF